LADAQQHLTSVVFTWLIIALMPRRVRRTSPD
jgi:hypothetical protein